MKSLVISLGIAAMMAVAIYALNKLMDFCDMMKPQREAEREARKWEQRARLERQNDAAMMPPR